MAITTTWSVSDMTHKDSDGGVSIVYWSLIAQSDGTPSYSAQEGGKLRCTADPSASDYIAYADLTEANVLGWVQAVVGKSDTETKLQAMVDEKKTPTTATGVPW